MFTEYRETLKRNTDKDPNFVASFRAKITPPTRAYVHKTGMEDIVGESETLIDGAAEYLFTSIKDYSNLVSNADFLIAAIWSNQGVWTIDLIEYSDIKCWPGNPSITAYVVKDGVYAPEDLEITCEDTIIVLGEEARYRRKTNSLEEYMDNPPSIPGLIPTQPKLFI